jgi:glycosyltransferase involved in cell wall biosynthesis
MPNALLEAMCIGLPCISTKVSGATDLIQTGMNGLLVDLDDVKQMSDAMKTFADNTRYCEQLGREASRVYEKLSPEIINNKWIEYINKKIKE